MNIVESGSKDRRLFIYGNKRRREIDCLALNTYADYSSFSM